jgi:hypothetical protein
MFSQSTNGSYGFRTMMEGHVDGASLGVTANRACTLTDL